MFVTVYKTAKYECRGVESSQRLAIMYAPIYHNVPKGFVYTLGYLVINRSIRRHLCTPLSARPRFCCEQKLSTYPLPPALLIYVPAFDKARCVGGVTAIRSRPQTDFEKTN